MNKSYLICVDESSIERDEHIIVTYDIETTSDTSLGQIGEVIAYDPTIGTWAKTQGETDEIIEAYSGKLLLPLPSESAQRGRIRIAIPVHNINPKIGGVPHMWAILGAPYTLKQVTRIHLVNIDVPRSFTDHLPGPQFGIAGIREIMGVTESRPFLATMLKPRTGLSSDGYAQLALDVYRGGVDIVFDDELLVSPESSPLFERAERVKAVAIQVEAETGEPKRYAANVTSSVRYLREMSLKAKAIGVDFLYLNPVSIGLSALEMVASDDEICLPILCCRSSYGMLTRGNDGIAFFVLLKLARFCGADGMHIGSIGGRLPHAIIGDDSKLRSRVSWLRTKLKHVKRTFPIVSGGLHPGNLERNVERLGKDIIIQAGSGVIGHPDGPLAGGKAMRDALNAVLQGIPTFEAAHKSAELEAALGRWGYLDGEGVHDLDELWAEPPRQVSGTTIYTSGGSVVIGDVDTRGGDFVGRDQCRGKESGE